MYRVTDSKSIKKLQKIKKYETNMTNYFLPPYSYNGSTILIELFEFFKQNKITAVPFYGTLLGFKREKNFIKSDMDIDILIDSKNIDIFIDNFHLLYDKGYKIRYLLSDNINDYDIHLQRQKHGKFEQENIIFGTPLCLVKNKILIDMEFYDFEKCLFKKYLNNLEKMSIFNYDIFVPKYSDELLTILYQKWKYPPIGNLSYDMICQPVGVILAAGMGTRLKPITDTKPKCLVKVNNKPIIDYIIESFIYANLKKIYIVVGYKKEQVKKYVINKYKNIKIGQWKNPKNNKYYESGKINLQIIFVDNDLYETTNNMFSFNLLKPYLFGRNFISINGDICLDKTIIQDMKYDKNYNLIACDKNKFIEENMKITLNNQNNVNNISKNIVEKNSYATSIDCYKISCTSSIRLFNIIKNKLKNNVNDWFELALYELFQYEEFKPFNINKKKWYEVDNHEDKAIASLIFQDLKIKNIILDMDGTIFKGDLLISDNIFINKLIKNYNVLFLTNNSSKTKEEYIKKLIKFGIKKPNVINSLHTAILYLKKNNIVKIYAVCNKNIELYLKELGFILSKDDPEYILMTFDTELNENKILTCLKLINKGIKFFATHTDKKCPMPNEEINDIGVLLNKIKNKTNKNPDKIFGKECLDLNLYLKDFNNNNTIIIGDRISTDMKCGINNNIIPILSLSGISDINMFLESNLDYVIENINSLKVLL